ncbi:holin [Hahella ganghwensis]|uniref:holin n=1 Tax=Hahella ganghwensis TaxID=286420 RepID=UPI0003AAEC5F|nr:holin [Hahella ganghwensis]
MPDKSATAASYAVNSGVAIYGTLTLNQWLALLGFALALATFAVNWYYQRRRDKRYAEYHELRVKVMEGEKDGGR